MERPFGGSHEWLIRTYENGAHPLRLKSSIIRETCELILTDIKGLPQQQYILDKANQQQVALNVDNNKWVVQEDAKAFYLNSTFLVGSAFLPIVSLIVLLH